MAISIRDSKPFNGPRAVFNTAKKNRKILTTQSAIVWMHLGLGDQISAAPILESYLRFGHTLYVPVKKRNLRFMQEVYGQWSGVVLVPVDDHAAIEGREVRKAAKTLKLPIVKIGHLRLKAAQHLFPELSLNAVFNVLAGVSPDNLTSLKLRQSLGALHQMPVPIRPFAFVDHHPGTDREIPSSVLNGIETRGLEIVYNPRDLPLSAMLHFLDEASELHMVPSAPLCLALTVDANAKTRYHYDILCDPVSKSYPRWKSQPLNLCASNPVRLSRVEMKIKNRLLAWLGNNCG